MPREGKVISNIRGFSGDAATHAITRRGKDMAFFLCCRSASAGSKGLCTHPREHTLPLHVSWYGIWGNGCTELRENGDSKISPRDRGSKVGVERVLDVLCSNQGKSIVGE